MPDTGDKRRKRAKRRGATRQVLVEKNGTSTCRHLDGILVLAAPAEVPDESIIKSFSARSKILYLEQKAPQVSSISSFKKNQWPSSNGEMEREIGPRRALYELYE